MSRRWDFGDCCMAGVWIVLISAYVWILLEALSRFLPAGGAA